MSSPLGSVIYIKDVQDSPILKMTNKQLCAHKFSSNGTLYGAIMTCVYCGMREDEFYDSEKTRVIDKIKIQQRCECGATTAGFSTHSHWCPEFTEFK